MFSMDASGLSTPAPWPRASRRRNDWIRGDVCCLMCGRLIGCLLGIPRRPAEGGRSAGHPAAFIAYRPIEPTGQIVRFSPGQRFQCGVCGGAGALDDVDLFSTYDNVSADEQVETLPVHRGPGRPPKQWEPPTQPTGLDAAIANL